jgi:hypothetical protein
VTRFARAAGWPLPYFVVSMIACSTLREWPAYARLSAAAPASHLPTAPTPTPGTGPALCLSDLNSHAPALLALQTDLVSTSAVLGLLHRHTVTVGDGWHCRFKGRRAKAHRDRWEWRPPLYRYVPPPSGEAAVRAETQGIASLSRSFTAIARAFRRTTIVATSVGSSSQRCCAASMRARW